MTVPNSFIMSSHTVNYSTSAREYGLIIHSEVSIGYDVPWRQVNQILIDAALNTPGVVDDPRPFVLETSLSDWYPVYQINAYIKQADKMAQIYSDLHQNIQDKFNEAGIEIMSPHYMAVRDGNESTTPKEYQKAIILLIKPEKKVNLNSFSIYPSYPFIRQLVFVHNIRYTQNRLLYESCFLSNILHYSVWVAFIGDTCYCRVLYNEYQNVR